MKVKELIAALNKFNPNMEVRFCNTEDANEKDFYVETDHRKVYFVGEEEDTEEDYNEPEESDYFCCGFVL